MNCHVVIVGGGLAGLSTAFFLQRPGLDLTVVEREAQVGGKLGASVARGYTVDWAANGFLPNVPETLELARQLGLAGELQEANPVAAQRFLYQRGALRALPTSPLALLRSPLLLPSEKLRAALEPLSARKRAGQNGRDKTGEGSTEESVYDFVARHFGHGVAETFAGPFVLGVTAGDAKQLSLDALFPRFRALEREHGSLLRGLVKTRRARAAAQVETESSGAAARPERLTSFRQGGMHRLIGALREQFRGCVRCGQGVTRLEPPVMGTGAGSGMGYRLTLESGEQLVADAVVLATPAFVSARLLAPFCPAAASPLLEIPYADVYVFGLGYHRLDVPNALDGFGFLVPRGEGVRSLGVLYSSSFPDQAPGGRVLLRVIAGGSTDPGFAALSKAQQLKAVRRDLRLTLGIVAEPEYVARIPWPQGIPQYTLGHLGRVAKAREAVSTYPGLILTGNAYDGVGVNDTVRSAQRAAGQLLEARQGAC